MKRETYIRMTEYIKERPLLRAGLIACNRVITSCTPMIYAGVLLLLLIKKDSRIYAAILIPMISFLILSMVRSLINRERPYEKFETESVLPKEKQGQSFPSRHVFSIFVIAMTVLLGANLVWLGICLFLAGIVLGALRVLLGVHYISDVLAGAVVGIFSGLFFLLF